MNKIIQRHEIKKKSTVALVRCERYNKQEVFSAVQKGFSLLGDPSSFFNKGEKIVLKPSVLAGIEPEYCVTTHPSVFEGVIKVLKDFGVNLSYGDSPGLYKVEEAVKKSGLHEVAVRYEVPLADFKNWKTVKHKEAVVKGSFSIVNGVLESDGLVSISKFKTHGLTRITGAIKNQFGCVPGLTKPRYHAQIPLVHDFSAFMVDINTFLRPRFFIMDAVMAMEGNGPQSGDPKKLSCLLFSDDPVALDAVACKIININPKFIPTCRAGQNAGLGTCDLENIEITGDPVETFIDKSFKITRKPPFFAERSIFTNRFKNILMPKPVINASLCKMCGKCIEVCPVEPKALSWNNENTFKSPPKYSYKSCIRCFCCQEICPEKAINIKASALSAILPAFVMFVITMSAVRFVFKHVLRKLISIIKRQNP